MAGRADREMFMLEQWQEFYREERKTRRQEHQDLIQLILGRDTNPTVSLDKQFRSITEYSKGIAADLENVWKSPGTSSLVDAETAPLMRVTRILHVLRSAGPVCLGNATYSFDSLTKTNKFDNDDRNFLDVVNVLRRKLQSFCDLKFPGMMLAYHHTMLLQQSELDVISVQDWWHQRVVEPQITAYAGKVSTYAASNIGDRSITDVSRILFEMDSLEITIAGCARAQGYLSVLDDAREALVDALTAVHSGFGGTLSATRQRLLHLTKQGKSKISGNAYSMRVSRATAGLSPHALVNSVCIDTGTFHSLCGNKDFFLPGSITKPPMEFAHISIEGVTGGTPTQIAGVGTIFTWLQIDDPGSPVLSR